jgi:hypothetical protein
MATVVNAFDSPQVQSAVYDMLIEALDTKLEADGLGRAVTSDGHPSLPPTTTNGELTHELIEGDSIHAEQPRRTSRSATTVF